MCVIRVPLAGTSCVEISLGDRLVLFPSRDDYRHQISLEGLRPGFREPWHVS
jgi:hypothetical protein